jgi:FkbM family methyltransferase
MFIRSIKLSLAGRASAISRRRRSIIARFRDRFYRNWIIKVRTEDGVIPYTSGDVIGYNLWIKGKYENIERAVVRALVANCRVFVDVGANSGIYTLLASKNSRPDSSIHAFEASPIEYQKLMLTIEWNALHNVIANNLALSESNGTTSIYENLDGCGALNRVDRPALDNGRYRMVEVPCVSLDTYCESNKISRIDFLKIDVEGHELPVLKGGRRTIAEDRPVIMVEMNDRRSSDQSSPKQLWAFLESYSYVWHQADPLNGRLVSIHQPEVFGYLNLFAIPSEKIGG